MLVVAVGGNALLERGEKPDAAIQQRHTDRAGELLAPLAHRRSLVITHGNGPQVGLLAAESAADPSLSVVYPFDALGAESQGMIGYWFVQAISNALPRRRTAALLCRTLVDRDDPAFAKPTKFIGPVYDKSHADAIASERGWTFAQDGTWWRRVVASPEPRHLLELPAIRTLSSGRTVLVCAGGGGVPVTRDEAGKLQGVEAVIDKDLTASLLARLLDAEALIILTDVAGVQLGFGTDHAQLLRRADPAYLRAQGFPAGSMGPKVEAACRFVEATGRRAMIGALDDADKVAAGGAGTLVEAGAPTESEPLPPSAS